MTMKSIKAIFRRGQTVKLDSGLDDLSRTSSVNNLSIDVKNKGAKPRKSESRDRIDRIAVDFKKSDGQGTLTKNNNQLEAGTSESSSYSLDSLQRQLQDMANEKSNLALQLGEKNGQLNLLQKEIEKLKVIKDDSHVRLEHLNEENTLLRNRLRDIAHSPLSDNEKQQLLYESHRQHSSAPASITTNAFEDVNNEDGDHNTCPTPDWDKHSSSNASEVSVACLQDKINQMQETHYSTNEELQATLQELTDLQRQLTELQQENERLNDEKTLMFDSLCRQTERLNDSRSEVENLKVLLYREKDDSDSNYEREQKLVTLLKTAQDERESLLHNLEQFRMDMNEKQREIDVKDENIRSCSERNRTLESGLEQKQTEFKQLDLELIQFRDKFSNKQIEVNRLMDLLENARGKIAEMEETRKKLGDKSELDEILDAVRKEKDTLEEEVAHLKEQCARARNEGEKLKEHVDDLQEECKVTRNNAKSIQSDLEYKCQKLKQEKSIVTEQLQQFQETINELQMQNQFQLEEKRQLQAVLSETQRNLNEAERKNRSLEMDLCELKKHKDIENEEWEKFQNDLLTSVRVANDFKTEAQQDLQKMILENKAHREKVRQLEAQIDKLKVSNESVNIRPSSFLGSEELTLRRQKAALSRENSRQSVKSLIESIESQDSIPAARTSLSTVSKSSSGSSLNSLASDIHNNANPSIISSSASTIRNGHDWATEMVQQKIPLKDQQPNKTNRDTRMKNYNDLISTDSKLDDGFRETILQKNLDFSRRNSYSDLCERKDPLNGLVKNGGSKRNALLKWCQNKTVGYRNIDITNFSSSWNDGLALCALLHTYLPDRIPYDSLTALEKRRNFSLAFSAAESVDIPTTLNINDMIQLERPDWQQVMLYVTAIYKHFET